jgi:hypothetical protein
MECPCLWQACWQETLRPPQQAGLHKGRAGAGCLPWMHDIKHPLAAMKCTVLKTVLCSVHK